MKDALTGKQKFREKATHNLISQQILLLHM